MFNSCRHISSRIAGTTVQWSLAHLSKSYWHGFSKVASTVLQHLFVWFFTSNWHNLSQQFLTRFFNSHRHDFWIVAGTIVEQLLASLFNSHWHSCSKVTNLMLQLLLEQFFTLHKKWSFPLRISSVNVSKSAVSCGFGHIY